VAAVASPLTRLVAVVDPVRERAERLALAAGGGARGAESLGEVLGEIDAAVIATPNDSHCRLALECLEAGVSTLIEKPLARSVAEGEAIAQAARASGRTVAVGYCTRFLENVRLLGELLGSGYFGALRRFDYQFGSVRGWSSLSGFHLDREAVGGGLLVTTGTHFLDRMLWWFGYPSELALEDDSRGGPEANALASFGFETPHGRFEGRVRLSRTVALQPGFVLQAERGTVLLRDGADAALRFRPADRPGLECLLARSAGAQRPGAVTVFQTQLEDFARACRGEGPPLVPVEQGVEAIRLVTDLYARRTPLATDWYDAARRGAR
jgi:predicted dehydrogenase